MRADARPANQSGSTGESPPVAPDAAEQVVLLATVALGMFWALQATNYRAVQPWTVALLFIGVLIGWSVLQRAGAASWLTLGYAVAVGIADRLPRLPINQSDVLRATDEALGVLSQGQNPYAHFFTSTSPPGSLLPYPPGEIFFYAIPRALFGQIFEVDKWSAIFIVLLLASLAFCVGPAHAAIATALYATFGQAALLSVDGSNDTSLAFLLVLAIVLLAFSQRGSHGARWSFYASAAVFAWALAFKEFAWLLYPFILTHLYRRGDAWPRYAAVSVVPAAVVSLYFFAIGPGDFLHNVVGEITVHQDIFGVNLWSGLNSMSPELVQGLRPAMPIIGLIAGAVVAVPLLLRPAERLSTAVFQGLAVIFVALFFSRWTAAPYYSGAAAVLAAAIALSGFEPSKPVAQTLPTSPDRRLRPDRGTALVQAARSTLGALLASGPHPRPLPEGEGRLQRHLAEGDGSSQDHLAQGNSRFLLVGEGSPWQQLLVPAICGMVAVTIALVAVVPTLATAGGRTSVLVHISNREPMANVARAIDPNFAFVPPQAHSDGVHFYTMAIDPFGFGSAHALIDDSVYRYGHPGFGWLAGILSLGQAGLLPTVMLLANLALLAAAAVSVSLIACHLGRSAWWGMLAAFNPGFIFAATDDTSEPAVMAITALGVLLWLRRRRAAYIFLAAGCFVKEVGLLVPAGIALFELMNLVRAVRPVELLRSGRGSEIPQRLIEALRSGPLTRLLGLAIGPALFILWWIYVRIQFGAWPLSEQGLLTFPLTGVADSLTRGANWLFGNADQVQIGAASVAFVAAAAAGFVLVFLRSIRLRTLFQGILLLMALLVLSESWLELLYPKDLIRDAAVPFMYLALALLAGDGSRSATAASMQAPAEDPRAQPAEP